MVSPEFNHAALKAIKADLAPVIERLYQECEKELVELKRRKKMSTLETLIGRPLHEIPDDELEEIIMRGRTAREQESASAKSAMRKASAAGRKKKPSAFDLLPDIDLDDDDFELE